MGTCVHRISIPSGMDLTYKLVPTFTARSPLVDARHIHVRLGAQDLQFAAGLDAVALANIDQVDDGFAQGVAPVEKVLPENAGHTCREAGDVWVGSWLKAGRGRG